MNGQREKVQRVTLGLLTAPLNTAVVPQSLTLPPQQEVRRAARKKDARWDHAFYTCVRVPQTSADAA